MTWIAALDVDSFHAAPTWANEFELCRAWTRLPRSVQLQTTDGRSVDVIHLGIWTHGLGPDFRDALFSIDNGPVVGGSIELHLRNRGWIEHGHHLDPTYNAVELHVVSQFDPVEIRRADGKIVPTVVLPIDLSGNPPEPMDWALVGGETCAEAIADSHAVEIRAIVGRLGDRRLSERTASFEASLNDELPETVLFAAILDALGYARNREGMRQISEHIAWPTIALIAATDQSPFERLAALFLGTGGYLALSDIEAGAFGIDPEMANRLAERWRSLNATYATAPLNPTIWELGRIRPPNHPGVRLLQAASLVAATKGALSAALLEPLRDGIDPTATIVDLASIWTSMRLGEDRARAITTNVVIPFALALGGMTGDHHLVAQTGELWESLPGAESNERTRRATRQIAGDRGIRKQGARIQQGLIHLDRSLCEPRRCFECPIATLVLANQSVTPVQGSGKVAQLSSGT